MVRAAPLQPTNINGVYWWTEAHPTPKPRCTTMTKHTEPNNRPARPAPEPTLDPSPSNWRLPRPGQNTPSWRLSK